MIPGEVRACEPALELNAGRERESLVVVVNIGHPPVEPHETLLAGPGGLHWEITAQAHVADAALDPTCARWRQLTDSGARPGQASRGR
ncbi:MAG: hypothetical protein ACRDOY_14040 [Nocardioidaceae bacterium]